MTGVDPEQDDIIEVGAVRFDASGGRATFSTLVNPGRPLPFRIRTLTGITDEELQSAPPFEVVFEPLREFIGAAPVVGQQVGFDLLYLAKHGLRPPGPVYNTAEIAELLMPGRSEYGLRALVRHFGIEFPVQHRAVPDAEAALRVFLELRDVALAVDPLVLSEIVALTSVTPWPLRHFFREYPR